MRRHLRRMLTYAIWTCIRYQAACGEAETLLPSPRGGQEVEAEEEEEEDEEEEAAEGVPEHIGSGMFEMGVMERKSLVSKAHALLLRSSSVSIRQHTSAYVSTRAAPQVFLRTHL